MPPPGIQNLQLADRDYGKSTTATVIPTRLSSGETKAESLDLNTSSQSGAGFLVARIEAMEREYAQRIEIMEAAEARHADEIKALKSQNSELQKKVARTHFYMRIVVDDEFTIFFLPLMGHSDTWNAQLDLACHEGPSPLWSLGANPVVL